MDEESQILSSWRTNAGQWIDTVDQGRIESRNLATNQAIIETIRHYHHPGNFLDLGCGEGWLTRTLTRLGIPAIGVDGTPALIGNARQKGEGHFEVATYQQIAKGHLLPGEPFDGIVINFGLFTDEPVTHLLGALQKKLSADGTLFIQTVHPFFPLRKGQPYESHWENNSWEGLPGPFTQPHPWFFRTLEDWIQLFTRTGFRLKDIREPLHPDTRQPLSIIFVLGCA